MTAKFDMNRMIKEIANKRLSPYEIFQKGKSRTFLRDMGWYTILIEFQPSLGSQGTYLNIGADFNFYPRENFAFSYGYRQREFEDFKNSEQLSILVNELCDLSIKKVKQICNEFRNIPSALTALQKEKLDNTWRIYEMGILYAFSQNLEAAKQNLKKVSLEKCEYDWQVERKTVTDNILNWIDNNSFTQNMTNLIAETRKLKKLPKVNLDTLTK
jgi:hypothetical protein